MTLHPTNRTPKSDPLQDIAEALTHIGHALGRLGNGDATTHFGAIEGHSMAVRDGLEGIADSLSDIAASLVPRYRAPMGEEDRRFTAALAIYRDITRQQFGLRDSGKAPMTSVVSFATKYAVEQADGLLAELDATVKRSPECQSNCL